MKLHYWANGIRGRIHNNFKFLDFTNLSLKTQNILKYTSQSFSKTLALEPEKKAPSLSTIIFNNVTYEWTD